MMRGMAARREEFEPPPTKRSTDYIPVKVKTAHRNMIYRVDDPNHPDYPRYGGAGIWIEKALYDIHYFYKVLGDPPTPQHSLDRIRCDGHYASNNIRWATRREQQNNRRIQVKHPYKGEFLTCAELAVKLGLSHETMRKRLRNWYFEDAISKPKRVWGGK